MKRIIAFAMALITVISLCACTDIKTRPFAEDEETKKSEQKTERETEAESLGHQNAQKPQISNGHDAETLAPPDTEEPNSPIKTGKEYRSTKEGYFTEEYAPRVVFDASGRFVLTENLFEGMGKIEGSYSLADNLLVLKVEKINYGGYGGDSLTEIRFTVNPDGSLTLNTDICLSSSGDIFRAP